MRIQDFLQNPDYKQKFVLEKLIQEYLGYNREAMRLNLDKEIEESIIQKIHTAYEDYSIHKKPLEYILGHVDFFGIPFYVNEHTLIPRPETEYMITAVTEHITPLQKSLSGLGAEGRGRRGRETKGSGGVEQHEKPRIPQRTSLTPPSKGGLHHTLLDIGTGCGVLGISVLLQNPNFFSQAYFSDISLEALEVAKRNYECLVTTPFRKGGSEGSEQGDFLCNTHFRISNLADFLISSPHKISPTPLYERGHIILVANLPYIPDETFDNNALENVQKREPRLAFVGGDDGLDLYRKMFEQIRKNFSPVRGSTLKGGGGYLTMFLEMMTRQVDILKAEFGDRLKFEEVKTFHFNIRIMKAWIK